MNNLGILVVGSVLLTISQCAPFEISEATTETFTESITQVVNEIAKTTEKPPTIALYEFNKTDTGYMYTLFLGNSLNSAREETLEVKNKGTSDEETVLSGYFSFNGEDGFKYIVKYMIDKNGNEIKIDQFQWNRISPVALKSLVG